MAIKDKFEVGDVFTFNPENTLCTKWTSKFGAGPFQVIVIDESDANGVTVRRLPDGVEYDGWGRYHENWAILQPFYALAWKACSDE